MKRKIAQKSRSKNSQVQRDYEPVSRKYLVLTVFCGLFLAVGFFGAARQHFGAIDYGIRNAKLRKQVEEIKSDQRLLQLAKEVALSPGEIKKNAQNIGFTAMTASRFQTFGSDRDIADKPNANIQEVSENAQAVDKQPLAESRKDKTELTREITNRQREMKMNVPVIGKPEPKPGKQVAGEKKNETGDKKSEPKEEIADLATTRKRKL